MDTKKRVIVGALIGLVVGLIVVIVMNYTGNLDRQLEKASEGDSLFTYEVAKEEDVEYVKAILKPNNLTNFDSAFGYKDTGALKPYVDEVKQVSKDTDKYLKFAIVNPYDHGLVLYVIQNGEVINDLTDLRGENNW